MVSYIALFLFVCLTVSLVWSAIYQKSARGLFKEASLIFTYFVAGCSLAAVILFFLS